MTVGELRAADAIQRIPHSLGELNQTLIRIAFALERQNTIMEKLMGPHTIPTVPSNYTTPSPAPRAMPNEVESFTGEPLTR